MMKKLVLIAVMAVMLCTLFGGIAFAQTCTTKGCSGWSGMTNESGFTQTCQQEGCEACDAVGDTYGYCQEVPPVPEVATKILTVAGLLAVVGVAAFFLFKK